MNKDEIKKALKFCADINDCDNCPYDVVRSCSDRLKLDARELITEQEKEIERLTEKLKQVLLAVDTVKEMNAMYNIDEQRKRAVQEFAEKLKKYSYTDNCFTDGKWHRYVLVSDIDELLKEYE